MRVNAEVDLTMFGNGLNAWTKGENLKQCTGFCLRLVESLWLSLS